MQSPAPLLPSSRPDQPSISGKTPSPAALAVFPPHLPSEGCQRFQTLRLMVGIARQPARSRLALVHAAAAFREERGRVRKSEGEEGCSACVPQKRALSLQLLRTRRGLSFHRSLKT